MSPPNANSDLKKAKSEPVLRPRRKNKFMEFLSDFRKELKKNPGQEKMPSTEISRIAAQKWRQLMEDTALYEEYSKTPIPKSARAVNISEDGASNKKDTQKPATSNKPDDNKAAVGDSMDSAC